MCWWGCGAHRTLINGLGEFKVVAFAKLAVSKLNEHYHMSRPFHSYVLIHEMRKNISK